ncbi:hypothetical protein Pan216_02290 [Planctomycetes bacterium Pan216]|uniref:DUF2752 domain-containing protein n=1 Tax=Kolteria novifilia TaxID=2527975 RepID=A0A518AXF0_9BACT|nr:hypothetical protein Pan216_02290 [Planctomycetes bacterium Pan216]
MKLTWHRPVRGDFDHERLWGGVILLAAVTMLVWFGLFALPTPSCLFKESTGLPCPTCGSTRAVEALLSGKFGASLRLNPMVPAGAVLVSLYLCYAVVVVVFRLPRARLQIDDGMWWALLSIASAGFLGVWIYVVFDGR